MQRLTTFILISITLIFSLACVTLLGTPEPNSQPAIPEPSLVVTPIPDIVAPIPEDLFCPSITNTIVYLNSPQDIDSTDFNDEEGEEAYIVTYSIEDDELTDPDYPPISLELQYEREDTAKHQEIWDYFAALIPYEYRTHVAEFSIMTDGEGNILAAVAQTYDDPYLWGLHVDINDSYDYYFLTFTLMHEFGHLFTLAPNQVPPSLVLFNDPDDDEMYLEEIATCSTFHPGEGCANRDSYIYQFYDRFWFDIYDEWNKINYEEDEDLYYEQLDDFYYQYEDQFLTDYAVTHPAEDIAESFAFFIFSIRPDGDSIAEQKILFFYEYPELVEMRTQILNNLCTTFPQ